MRCTHCAQCRASNKCTAARHVCGALVRDAVKDIRPVQWQPQERQ